MSRLLCEHFGKHKLGKPLLSFRVDFLLMVNEWKIVPRANVEVRFTGKITEVNFPDLPCSFMILWVSFTLQSMSSSLHQGGSPDLRLGEEGSSSSSLLSLMGEMVRVSRVDRSVFLRASGVAGASGASAG